MKKLFLLLLLATASACNEDSETPKDPKSVYTGTLTVTSNRSLEAAVFLLENVRFELDAEADGMLRLTMHDIRFAEAMPRPLTIVIPSLKYGDAAGKGQERFYSTVDPIVPFIGGKPFDMFQILAFTGSYERSGEQLNISFTCKNPSIPVGSETLDHKAVFSGTLTK